MGIISEHLNITKVNENKTDIKRTVNVECAVLFFHINHQET